MARKRTTSDVFNAVAEPQRRQILDLLAQGERSVNDIAELLKMRQPQVSKHLNVLKQVGLVNVRGAAKQRLYTLNSQALKPIHDWTMTYEHFWSESFERLDELLDEMQAQEKNKQSQPHHKEKSK